MRYIILLIGSNHIKLLEYAHGYILRMYTASKMCEYAKTVQGQLFDDFHFILCITYSYTIILHCFDPRSQLTHFNRYTCV